METSPNKNSRDDSEERGGQKKNCLAKVQKGVGTISPFG